MAKKYKSQAVWWNAIFGALLVLFVGIILNRQYEMAKDMVTQDEFKSLEKSFNSLKIELIRNNLIANVREIETEEIFKQLALKRDSGNFAFMRLNPTTVFAAWLPDNIVPSYSWGEYYSAELIKNNSDNTLFDIAYSISLDSLLKIIEEVETHDGERNVGYNWLINTSDSLYNSTNNIHIGIIKGWGEAFLVKDFVNNPLLRDSLIFTKNR